MLASIAAVGIGALLAAPALGQTTPPLFIDAEPNGPDAGPMRALVTGGVLYEGVLRDGADVDMFKFRVRPFSPMRVSVASLDNCTLSVATGSFTIERRQWWVWSPTLEDGGHMRATRDTQFVSLKAGPGATGPCRWQFILGPDPTPYGPGITGLEAPPKPAVRLVSSARTDTLRMSVQLPPHMAGLSARFTLEAGRHAGTQGDTPFPITHTFPIVTVPADGRLSQSLRLPSSWRQGAVSVQVGSAPTGPWQSGIGRHFNGVPSVATSPLWEGLGLKVRPPRIDVGRSFCSPRITQIRWRKWSASGATGVGRGIVAGRLRSNDSCLGAAKRAGVKRTTVKLSRPCAITNDFSRIVLIQGSRVVRYTRGC